MSSSATGSWSSVGSLFDVMGYDRRLMGIVPCPESEQALGSAKT